VKSQRFVNDGAKGRKSWDEHGIDGFYNRTGAQKEPQLQQHQILYLWKTGPHENMEQTVAFRFQSVPLPIPVSFLHVVHGQAQFITALFQFFSSRTKCQRKGLAIANSHAFPVGENSERESPMHRHPGKDEKLKVNSRLGKGAILTTTIRMRRLPWGALANRLGHAPRGRFVPKPGFRNGPEEFLSEEGRDGPVDPTLGWNKTFFHPLGAVPPDQKEPLDPEGLEHNEREGFQAIADPAAVPAIPHTRQNEIDCLVPIRFGQAAPDGPVPLEK